VWPLHFALVADQQRRENLLGKKNNRDS
jgi:hypothetical protein